MSGGSKILLAIFGALGLGLGAWFVLDGSGGDERSEGPLALTPGGGGEPVRAAGRAESNLATPEPPPEEEPTRVEEHVVEEPKVAAPYKVSDAIWVEGQIHFPPETPADEVVSVFARGKRFKGKQEDPKEYSAAVQPNGKFRVAFAKGTKRGRIGLRAKYLYLESYLKLNPAEVEEELRIEPKLGGLVVVKVAPPTQEPLTAEEIEGVKVLAYGEDMPIQRTAKHDDGDRFLLSALAPAKDYWLNIRSDHYVATDRKKNVIRSGGRTLDSADGKITVRAGEVTEVDVQLDYGVRLAGIVIDPDREPIAGANINIRIEAGDASAWESVTTEKDGTFEKGGLPAGEVQLTISEDGFAAETLELGRIEKGTSRDDFEIELSLGISVEGLVTWGDGRPAAGAKVSVSQDDEDRDYWYWGADGNQETDADSSGAFKFSGLEANDCTLRARAQPELTRLEGESKTAFKRRRKNSPYWHARMDEVQPGSGRVVLVLEEGGVLRGRVVDDAGNAVEKFRVTAKPKDSDGPFAGSRGRVSKTFQDPSGKFVLEGLEGGDVQRERDRARPRRIEEPRDHLSVLRRRGHVDAAARSQRLRCGSRLARQTPLGRQGRPGRDRRRQSRVQSLGGRQERQHG